MKNKNLIEYFTRTSPLLDRQDCWHRIGVSDCPHCGADYHGKDLYIWDKYPHVAHVIFEAKYRKIGMFVVVSTCPKCHKLSWVHHEYDSIIRAVECDLECLPESERRLMYDLDKLKEARAKILKKLDDEWNRSLCKKCVNLNQDKLELKRKGYTYYNHTECDGRSGPPAQPDEDEPFKCKRFKEKTNP